MAKLSFLIEPRTTSAGRTWSRTENTSTYTLVLAKAVSSCSMEASWFCIRCGARSNLANCKGQHTNYCILFGQMHQDCLISCWFDSEIMWKACPSWSASPLKKVMSIFSLVIEIIVLLRLLKFLPHIGNMPFRSKELEER